MSDNLVQALARQGRIRVIACDSTELAKEAQKLHGLWSTATVALGRVLTVGALMGAMLKEEDEKITIEINGGGPLGLILVNAYEDGRVRGYVSQGEVSLKYNDSQLDAVSSGVGKEGYLRVIKDLNLKEDFTGTVELISGEIGDDFAFYFAASEQIPTSVTVGVSLNDKEEVTVACGMIVQMMPGATEEDIVYAEEVVKKYHALTTVVSQNKTISEVVLEAFDDAQIVLEKPIHFGCDCSKERMRRALMLLDKNDLVEMFEEDHGAEIICHYCNTKYYFNEDELRELL